MFTVREHKISYGVGILIFLMGIGLFVLELYHHIGPIPIWIYFAILAICLLGILFCIGIKNRKLMVEENELNYVNYIGREKQFSLQEIGYAKAGINRKIGQDFVILYDKAGNKLCKLEFSMENADNLLIYLHDSGITIDVAENSENSLMSIVYQEETAEEQRSKIAEDAYGETVTMIQGWMEKNKRIGAQLEYGFAEYYGNRIREELEVQKEECRYSCVDEESLPQDYLCVMELYVKKEGNFIRDRKNQLLMMSFPIVYKKKTLAGDKEFQLYRNKNYRNELEEVLGILAKYLPGHKFFMDSMELGYELKKNI